MNTLDNTETDNPFTLIGLLTIIIEDITRLEKRIDLLKMENNLLIHYISKLLKELQEALQRK